MVHLLLQAIIRQRRIQPAFHPNATQFTLHLGDSIFGFWRQSMDREQSIFCISNITTEEQSLLLSDINLIDNENWFDILTRETCGDQNSSLQLQPYQTLWITNKNYETPV
jgi:sucrose phosphorylase